MLVKMLKYSKKQMEQLLVYVGLRNQHSLLLNEY